MEDTNKNDQLLDMYNRLFEKKEGKILSEEDFLNKLIDLETKGKNRLFRTLLGSKTNKEVRTYLAQEGRLKLEKQVSKKYLGKSMTIGNIIDEFAQRIKKTFNEKPLAEALRDLGVVCKKVDGTILLPEGESRINIGDESSGESLNFMKFKKFQEKFQRLFTEILTIENDIFPWDYEVYYGENKKDMLRYDSYIAVKINKLDKTIFINNMSGESTFVCDTIVSEKDMTTKGKKTLRNDLGDKFHSLSYSEDKKNEWKLNMIDLICGPEKGSRKFVRDAFMNKNGTLTEKGKERFGFYVRNKAKARITFCLEGIGGYIKIAKIFGFQDECNSNLYKNEKFDEVSRVIFGENYPGSRQEQVRQKLKKMETEWFSLSTCNSRVSFKLDNGPGYAAILTLFGLKYDKSFETFYKVSKVIYGEDNENVKKIEKLEAEKEQNLTAQEIREIYSTLNDVEKSWFQSFKSYRMNIKKIKERFGKGMPKTANYLIKLLGGVSLCNSLGYSICEKGMFMQALLISENEGQKYLENNCTKIAEKEQNLTAQEIREKYSILNDYEKTWFTTRKLYSFHINEIKEKFKGTIPSWLPLINLLGGNNKCSEGGYLCALLISEDMGKKYFSNRVLQKRPTTELIREIYSTLDDDEKAWFASHKNYELNIKKIKEKFGEGMPEKLCSLIGSLGAHNLCKNLGYKTPCSIEFVQALLISEKECQIYLEKYGTKK